MRMQREKKVTKRGEVCVVRGSYNRGFACARTISSAASAFSSRKVSALSSRAANVGDEVFFRGGPGFVRLPPPPPPPFSASRAAWSCLSASKRASSFAVCGREEGLGAAGGCSAVDVAAVLDTAWLCAERTMTRA